MREGLNDGQNARWKPEETHKRAGKLGKTFQGAGDFGRQTFESAKSRMPGMVESGKKLKEKAIEKGRELKEKTLKVLHSDRAKQSLEIMVRILESELIDLVPFMEAAKQGGTAIVGKDLKGQSLTSDERVKRGTRAVTSGVIDFATLGEGHLFAEGGKLAKTATTLQRTRHVTAITSAGRNFIANNPGITEQIAAFLEEKKSRYAGPLRDAIAILNEDKANEESKK
jgi:hypothetical protein